MSRRMRIAAPTMTAVICVLLAFGFVRAKKFESGIPWIGIYTQNINEDLAEAFDLDRGEGIVIVDVVDDSPADEAGLKKKDIVLEFNGRQIDPGDRLGQFVRKTEIGDEVEMVVLRNNQEKSFTVEIGKKPNVSWRRNHSWQDAQSLFDDAVTLNFSNRAYLGIGIQNLTEQLGEYFGIDGGDGVLVTEVFEDSPAEEAGLHAGDIILTVADDRIYDTDDLLDVLADFEDGDTVNIEYLRRGNRQTASVEVSEETFSGLGNYYFPHMNIQIPKVPKIPQLDHLYPGEDFGDYKKEMQELKLEMDELRKELKELESKLD